MNSTQAGDTTATRRAADKRAWETCLRTAEAMREDANRYQQMAETFDADPTIYGPRASDYRAGVQARLELVAGWCATEADRQAAHAAQYRVLITDAHFPEPTPTLGEEIDGIMQRLDEAGKAWVAAGYPDSGPVHDARESVFADLREWNDRVEASR